MEIGIIGGGTMGLTLAYRLGQAGLRVTVLEASPQLGGLATWFDYGDFFWDKFYHVICRSDAQLLGLIDELGISSKMRWRETKTGFLWRGRNLSMNNHWEFLTFPALSLIDKFRLALGILYCQRIRDAAPLERIGAADWLRRIFGRGTYQAIWEPLLESKYGTLKERMPATIMWATIRRYYSTRAKAGGQENLGFLSGGLKTFFDALERGIAIHNGIVHCNEPVISIDDSDPGQVLVSTSREKYVFDKLISTLPTALLERIAPGRCGPRAANPVQPQFLGVICLALILRRPLNPYYVTNLIQKGLPFTGMIGVSNLTGEQETGGKHLVMLPRYDLPDSPWFDKPAEEIARVFMDGLKTVRPGLDDDLVRYFVHRERRVQALWIDGPPPLAAGPLRNPQGTLWSVNAELTGRDTLNNNAIVRVASDAAREFRQSLSPAADLAGPLGKG